MQQSEAFGFLGFFNCRTQDWFFLVPLFGKNKNHHPSGSLKKKRERELSSSSRKGPRSLRTGGSDWGEDGWNSLQGDASDGLWCVPHSAEGASIADTSQISLWMLVCFGTITVTGPETSGLMNKDMTEVQSHHFMENILAQLKHKSSPTDASWAKGVSPRRILSQ